MSACRLGVDIGGTFTDAVMMDESTGEIRLVKMSSTPRDASIGFMDVIERVLAGIFCSSQRCLVPRPRHHGSHEYDYRGEGRQSGAARYRGISRRLRNRSPDPPQALRHFLRQAQAAGGSLSVLRSSRKARFRRPGIAALDEDAVRTVARVIKGEAWKRSLCVCCIPTSIRHTNSGSSDLARGAAGCFPVPLLRPVSGNAGILPG